MKLNYDKSEWERIPDRIQELHTKELDLTQHEERELHQMELDRRLWYGTKFLKEYSWDGTKRSIYEDDEDDAEDNEEEDSAGQVGLNAF